MTREERFEIYRNMLKAMLEDDDYKTERCLNVGFCYFMKLKYVGCYVTLEDLDELMEHKPRKSFSDGYWFNPYSTFGTTKRINILKTILKEA